MKRLLTFLRWWFFGPPADKPGITPTEAYEAGFANGLALGEFRGRNAACDELEAIVASRHNGKADADDVALLKQRTLH